MKAYLTFARRKENDVHMLGIENPINICDILFVNLRSGQPILPIILNRVHNHTTHYVRSKLLEASRLRIMESRVCDNRQIKIHQPIISYPDIAKFNDGIRIFPQEFDREGFRVL